MAVPAGGEATGAPIADSFPLSSPRPAPSPIQDGGEGDDELGDDDDSMSRDDDDEEGEEEEPRLKYQRLGGSVPSLLSLDACCVPNCRRADHCSRNS